jgi:hypothetical protein
MSKTVNIQAIKDTDTIEQPTIMMMIVYLRLQHVKGFHNLVYMSYLKHIDPASKT